MLDLIYVNLIILSLDFAVVVLLYLNQTVRNFQRFSRLGRRVELQDNEIGNLAVHLRAKLVKVCLHFRVIMRSQY